MPRAQPDEFTEEFRMRDGKGIKEERIGPIEVKGEEVPALDFDTVVDHLRRNGYEVEVFPNGGSLDAEGERGINYFDVSVLEDDAVQVEFSMDIEEAEERRGEDIRRPESYVEKVYDQIIDELVEREKKIERASESYVSHILEDEAPLDKLEKELGFYGENAGQVLDSYFGDSRPSELFMTYAVHFELYPGETVENEKRNLKGKLPSYAALKEGKERDRNKLYLRRYLEKVIEKVGEEEELSQELEEYWLDLQ